MYSHAIFFCGVFFTAIFTFATTTTTANIAVQQVTPYQLSAEGKRDLWAAAPSWHAKFTPQQLQLHMGTSAEVLLELTGTRVFTYVKTFVCKAKNE